MRSGLHLLCSASVPDRQTFTSSPPADALSLGRVSVVSVNDLTALPPSAPAPLPRGGTLTLTGLDLSPQPGIEMTGRGQDVSFGSTQFAVFRPR